MLNAICVDIVEMIVCCTKEYDLYWSLCKLVLKLNDKKRRVRIRDKLTEYSYEHGTHIYRLNGFFHREYNKPYAIDDHHSVVWGIMGIYKRNDCLPFAVSRSHRAYDRACDRDEKYPFYISLHHRKGRYTEMLVCEWYNREKYNLPIKVYCNGIRGKYNAPGIYEETSVFDYI